MKEKIIWSKYYGSFIEVIIVSSIKYVPGRCQYKYTDRVNGYDIYEGGNNKVFGVII